MARQVEVPSLGESVKQAILVHWHKADGDSVAIDEPICELETDKANVDVPSPVAGVLRRVKEEGETVGIGEVIARIDEAGASPAQGQATPAKKQESKTAKSSTQAASPASESGQAHRRADSPDAAASTQSNATSQATFAPEDYSPAVRKLLEEHQLNPANIPATGPGGRLTAEDVQGHINDRELDKARPQQAAPVPTPASTPPRSPVHKGLPDEKPGTRASAPAMDFDSMGVRRVQMSRMRSSIAQRLVAAQRTAAILTTFNEVDMTAIMDLRGKFKEQFEKAHGVGLGFMSFFARALVLALREFPRLNAYVEGEEIIYHNYTHLGIAVSTDRGLAVPVLRNVQDMSFARIEAEIKRLANATRDGKLSIDELSGGTFTVTNGGIFGSLLSTPILTPPQTGILGMHAIQKRAVVINDKIEIRPMMYVALSYDHRLVDGRESVSFLVRCKQYLEDPARLILEV